MSHTIFLTEMTELQHIDGQTPNIKTVASIDSVIQLF